MNNPVLQPEMLCQALAAGVVKGHDLPGDGVQRAQIAPFVTVAVKTTQTQIGFCRVSPVFFGVNVIDLMRLHRVTFVKQAIFTAPIRAIMDHSTKRLCQLSHA
jgi:hypothetical protein